MHYSTIIPLLEPVTTPRPRPTTMVAHEGDLGRLAFVIQPQTQLFQAPGAFESARGNTFVVELRPN